MNNLIALTAREWKAFWYSPVAYVVGAFFLLLQGWVFWLILAVLNDPRVDPTWRMANFFFGGTLFYWIPVLLMTPLMTMRTFSEEKRTGTFEVLLSAPVSDWQVVIAKFLGAWLSYCALWAITIVFFLILRSHTAIDWGPVWSGYLYTVLIGAALLSIGVLASSMTRNQVIAGFVGFVLMMLLFSVGMLDAFITDPESRKLVAYYSLFDHAHDFGKGLIDTRPIVLYLSLAAVSLFLTVRVIGSPRWRS